MSRDKVDTEETSDAATKGSVANVNLDQPLASAVEELEVAMVRYALKRADGRVEGAAPRLGVSRKGLFLKRKRLKI